MMKMVLIPSSAIIHPPCQFSLELQELLFVLHVQYGYHSFSFSGLCLNWEEHNQKELILCCVSQVLFLSFFLFFW